MARGDHPIGDDVSQGPEFPPPEHNGPQPGLDVLDDGFLIIPTEQAYQSNVDRALTDKINTLILPFKKTCKNLVRIPRR